MGIHSPSRPARPSAAARAVSSEVCPYTSAWPGADGCLQEGPHGLSRLVEGADKFATPVDGLYLCGQCTHPGPGVTGIPGWNGPEAALKHLDARVS